MDLLQNPIALAVIVLALVVAVVLLVIIRRRRAAADIAPPPEIGDAVDYTSIPYEEPTGLVDRLRNASPAVKALAVLLPLAVIGVIAALALSLFSGRQTSNTPLGPPPSITNVTAEVAGAGKIVVRADTNLPDGTQVSATMKQADQDFAWFNPNTAVTSASAGRITLPLDRSSSAPTPQQGAQYSVGLLATLPDGTLVSSEQAPLMVLSTFASDFYQSAAPAPTAAPTASEAATPAPTATIEPTAEATPEVAATQPITATARNGANIRQQPNTSGEILGQLSASESVEVVARSPDGQWYLVRGAAAEGWVSATLLAVDPAAAEQVPQQAPTGGPTANVFNGGNLRAAPNLNSAVLDQINAGEVVQLLARTDNGSWYQITNPRQITGWVSATLLEVSLEDRRALPVSDSAVATPLPATTEALPGAATPAPELSGLTAQVFNGGNVRSASNLSGDVLDQINAGEAVQLLGKTADGGWYRITNVRNVTGWVNRTLLTVDPEVARRVPVAE